MYKLERYMHHVELNDLLSGVYRCWILTCTIRMCEDQVQVYFHMDIKKATTLNNLPHKDHFIYFFLFLSLYYYFVLKFSPLN